MLSLGPLNSHCRYWPQLEPGRLFLPAEREEREAARGAGAGGRQQEGGLARTKECDSIFLDVAPPACLSLHKFFVWKRERGLIGGPTL